MQTIAIDRIDDERVSLYNVRKENQLKHALEPERGYFVVESDKCILRAMEAGYEVISFFIEAELVGRFEGLICTAEGAAGSAVLVYTATHETIKAVTGYNLTGGILCLMRRREEADLSALLDRCRRVVVLDDIENPTNLGSIFRSAAALNVDLVLLTHDCTDPLYRRSSRVSMGTVFMVPWIMLPAQNAAYIARHPGDRSADYMSILHEHGFKTAAMALKPDSVDIDDPALNAETKLAILMGNEGHGLSDKIIEDTDYTVCIPMSHDVDSLNVAVASAIAFWQLCR